MTALMLSTVLLLTIVLALVLGVTLGWAVCNAILHAMHRPQRAVVPPLTSVAAGSGH